MDIMKYQGTTTRTNVPLVPCASSPIIFQVFFSDFEDGHLIHEDARCFEFDFADNGYGKFLAEYKEIGTEEKEYYERMQEITTAVPIESRSIAEIEKDLISLVPVEPDLHKSYTTAYEDCKKAHEYFHHQDYDNAIEHYSAAADRQWTDHVAFCLSLAYYLKGDYPSAAAAASRYQGSVYEVATLGSRRYGMNAFVLDTTPIDKLNYLLEMRTI